MTVFFIHMQDVYILFYSYSCLPVDNAQQLQAFLLQNSPPLHIKLLACNDNLLYLSNNNLKVLITIFYLYYIIGYIHIILIAQSPAIHNNSFFFVQDNSGKRSGTFRSSPKPALRFPAETVKHLPLLITVFRFYIIFNEIKMRVYPICRTH